MPDSPKDFLLFLFYRFFHLLHRIDTHILDGLGEDEFIGDENNHSCFIYETGCGEGYFLDHAFISLDPDHISDFETVTENERETSREVRDGFFADKSEEYSSNPSTCYKSPDTDSEYSEYENE